MEKAALCIRYAQAKDNELLAELGARTFYKTFAVDNDPQSMADFMAAAFGPEKQSAELADVSTLFLIAEVAGTAIGYVKLQAGTTTGITGKAPMEIGRIYVAQEWLGRGIGAELMKASIHEAQQRGHDVLWLGVWEHNPRTRAFYRKWGFVEIGIHLFLLGNEPQTDVLMQLVPA